MKNCLIAVFFVGLASLTIAAQSAPEQTDSVKTSEPATHQVGISPIVMVELTKSLDASKTKAGDLVSTKVVTDTWIDDKTMLPDHTKLLGHVLVAAGRTKDNPQSKVAVVFDKAILKDGSEVPVNVIVVRVLAPQRILTHPSESPLPTMNETMSRAAGPVVTDGRTGPNTEPIREPIWSQYHGNGPFPDAREAGLAGLQLATLARKSESITEFRSTQREVKLDKGCLVYLKVVSPSQVSATQ